MHNGEASADLNRRYDEMYERYGRPLESEHRGEFAAISPQGEVILGSMMFEVAQQAADRFGPGSYLFKIGESTVGRWR